jgi:mannitol-specific phosphotransferase system IIBC component
MTLLKFGKNVNLLSSTSKLVIVAGAIFIISFMLGKSEGSDKLEKFNAEYSEFKNNAQKTVTYADSLKAEVQKLQEKNIQKDNIVKKLNISIATRSTQRDKLKTTLVKLEDHANLLNELVIDTSLVIIYKDSVIDNLKNQVIIADSTIVDQYSIIVQKDSQAILLQRAITLSSTRADSLQHILRALPKPAPNPNKIFGFIPKPSRTVIGITAFALGVVAGVELNR